MHLYRGVNLGHDAIACQLCIGCRPWYLHGIQQFDSFVAALLTRCASVCLQGIETAQKKSDIDILDILSVATITRAIQGANVDTLSGYLEEWGVAMRHDSYTHDIYI